MFYDAPNTAANLILETPTSLFDSSGPVRGSEGLIPIPGDTSSSYQSDMALFGDDYAMWVNGKQAAAFSAYYPVSAPDTLFPFTRLASATLVDQSATFLYHQMNGTTFAEEQWDASLSAWIPTVYITLPVF